MFPNIRPVPNSIRIWLLLAFASALVLLASLAPNVQAADLTVNSLNDPGAGVCDSTECTLREAIDAASSGDSIDFSVTETINLSSGHLIINQDRPSSGQVPPI